MREKLGVFKAFICWCGCYDVAGDWFRSDALCSQDRRDVGRRSGLLSGIDLANHSVSEWMHELYSFSICRGYYLQSVV
jgi:hypothetical protein